MPSNPGSNGPAALPCGIGRSRSLAALAGLLLLAAWALSACAPVPGPGERELLDAAKSLPKGALLAPDGSALKPGGLSALGNRTGYFLLGESHTNPCDHTVQAALITELAQAREPVSLGLEMVPADRQDVLDRFNAGSLRVQDLEEALDWASIWGHSFDLYAPLFRAARKADVDVYGLNLEQELLDSVSELGLEGLNATQRSRLPETVIPPPEEQLANLRKVFERHEAFLGEGKAPDSLERFLLIQSLWDTTMALEAARIRARTRGTVIIVSGAGHIEHDWGIVHRLRRIDPGAGEVSLLPWRGLEPLDPEAAEAFFFCPLSERSVGGRSHSARGAQGE